MGGFQDPLRLLKCNPALNLAECREVLPPIIQFSRARVEVIGHVLSGFEGAAVWRKTVRANASTSLREAQAE